MPLRKLLAERKHALAAALADPQLRGVQLTADPEAWHVAASLLAAVERGPDQPDCFVGVDLPAGALDLVAATTTALRAAAAAARIPLSDQPAATSARDALARLCDELLRAPALADARLVLVYGDHARVDAPGFDAGLAELVRLLDRRVVLVALDRRAEPRLVAFAAAPAVTRWDLVLGPSEIEAGLRDAAADPAASPHDRMRHLAGLAMFAAARREYPEALRLGETVRSFHAAAGDRGEEALAAFNLGTTHDRKGDHAAARAVYEDALRLAIAANNPALAQQTLHNLGCAWWRLEHFELAEAHLRGALQGADRIGHAFAACQSLESLGCVLHGRGRADAAAQAWREAWRRYAAMDPATAAMARAGQAQLERRLQAIGAEVQA
jgi:tetratricopeptide (TPR) repeat protein